MRPLTRIDPAGEAGSYKTYEFVSPPDLMIRAACAQVGCQAYASGWETTLDEATPLGRKQAGYIRRRSGRTFTEHRTAAGLTVFRFEPHQRCFAEHKTRPDFYSVRAGDWRADLGQLRRHVNGADWVEDFAEHQQTIADQIERG